MGFRRSLKNRLALVFFAIVAGAVGGIYFYVVPSIASNLRQEKIQTLSKNAAEYARPNV